MRVKIPAGVDHGTRIRMTGEGDSGGPKGIPGDLYVQIHVEPHELFERDGQDVYSEVKVSMADAALGTSLDIETLYGVEKVPLGPGTQPNTRLKLRAKGIPSLRGGGKGDHYIFIRVDVPTKLSREQKRLLEELRETLG